MSYFPKTGSIHRVCKTASKELIRTLPNAVHQKHYQHYWVLQRKMKGLLQLR